MTVSAQTRRSGPYEGDGSTRIFPYTFRAREKSHLLVTFADTDDSITELTLDTHYTVEGAGDPALNVPPNQDGGNIVLESGFATPTAGQFIVITSVVPNTQEYDPTNQGGYLPENLEDALDHVAEQIQDIHEVLARINTDPITDPGDVDLSDILARLNALDAAVAAAEAAAALAQEAAEQALSLISGLLFSRTVTLTAADSPYTLLVTDNGTLFRCDTTDGEVEINMTAIATLGTPFAFAALKEFSSPNNVLCDPLSDNTINESADTYEISTLLEVTSFIADSSTTPDNWGTRIIGLTAGDVVVDTYVAGTDYTAGVTTSLITSANAGIENALLVFFDGAEQHHTTFSFASATRTVTFDAAIPANVAQVEILTTKRAGVLEVPDRSITFPKIYDGVTTLNDGAPAAAGHIGWDWGADPFDAQVTLDGNHVFDAPSNARRGTRVLKIAHTGSVRVPTWDAAFKQTPVLGASDASHWDMVSIHCDGTYFYAVTFASDIS